MASGRTLVPCKSELLADLDPEGPEGRPGFCGEFRMLLVRVLVLLRSESGTERAAYDAAAAC
jgi:hypothetical protein